ncbi:alkaline phosphatase family protein [Spirosoma sp. KCTC 42546]|uniref:alkaline phosphatase family protein n=1 Tax=Spirosoma sp. KCTC 42546 TaxID=2520506 RepID=UPI001AF00248
MAYSPEQIPVLNGLAKNYAISDDWFSSMPSGTTVNRALVMSSWGFFFHMVVSTSPVIVTDGSDCGPLALADRYPHRLNP